MGGGGAQFVSPIFQKQVKKKQKKKVTGMQKHKGGGIVDGGPYCLMHAFLKTYCYDQSLLKLY